MRLHSKVSSIIEDTRRMGAIGLCVQGIRVVELIVGVQEVVDHSQFPRVVGMNGDVDPSGLTCGNQAERVSRLGDVSIVHRLFEEGVGESGLPFDARGDGLGICTLCNFFGGLSEYRGEVW